MKKLFYLAISVMACLFTACEPNNLNVRNEYESVDLGLSVKWATCNVGANTPEDYGNYYAWGETSTKTEYRWSTYQYGDGENFTKYGMYDERTILDISDDAAYMNWGGSWRMPTYLEWEELRNNCAWTWYNSNGVRGFKVTASNGNSIFLPATGEYDGSSPDGVGSEGGYWSCSRASFNEYTAHAVVFRGGGVLKGKRWYYTGLSVRPVCQ